MPSSILHVPPPSPSPPGPKNLAHQNRTKRSHYLVFFIPGNPGLIGYYISFLSTLSQLLSTTNNFYHAEFTIFGQSLPGFEDGDNRNEDRDDGQTDPYGLKQVIQLTRDTLLKQRIRTGERQGEPFDGVILMGHSVGSYITLELVREIAASPSSSLQLPSNPRPRIIQAILLFPTVTHIAQSPSGTKITALFKVHDFPSRVHVSVAWLLWFVSNSMLVWLIERFMNMPSEAAMLTARWLKSEKGVWQALHMARDEMNMITEDKWEGDIWGIEDEETVAEAAYLPPKLVFYFGRQDHWVADHTRDALIAARGRSNGPRKPQMMIDQLGMPHGFCLRHGEVMAERVKKWIDDVVELESESA